MTPKDSSREALRRFEPRARPAEGGEEKNEPPLHWPTLGAIPAQSQWPELRRWVEGLRESYPGLDSYVLPSCWYAHESLVGALQALKDFERAAYGPTSPGTAALEWHRALRDVSALLRQFVADLRCDHSPEWAQRDTFEKFVEGDISRRRRWAATVALDHSDESTTE